MFVHAKDLFVAAIGGGGHDEKEGAPAGGGLGAVPVPAGASWQSGSNVAVFGLPALRYGSGLTLLAYIRRQLLVEGYFLDKARQGR